LTFLVPLLWSAVAKRGGDTAFDFTEALGTSEAAQIASHQSGVAPVFPLAAAVHIKPAPAAASRKK
jgi:hypothetical protein